MRIRWRWVGLWLAIALLVGVSAGLFPAGVWEKSHSRPQPMAPRIALSTPDVDPDRLVRDMKALSFVRYEAGDRQRAAEYIERSLTAAGWQVARQPFGTGNTAGENLIATRPDAPPDRPKLLLAAHYDTVKDSPGADDNATAVATILEAARLLDSQNTPSALELVLFDREEAGLEGSEAFVADAARRQGVRGAVVMDMIGYGCEAAGCQSYPAMLPIAPPTDRGNFLAVIGDLQSVRASGAARFPYGNHPHPQLIQAFHQIADAPSSQVTPIFSLAVPLLGDLTPDLLRSDHTPFWKAGIGAVLLTDTANFRNPHYHQPSDTPDTLNVPFFLGSARLVIKAVDLLLHEANGLRD
ncbi:MAG: M20/M25/M40 family metallo-hydrolase [Cyanobacteriota bacterium]